jgi:glucokinase
MSLAIGIDIGGTFVKFVAISHDGDIVCRSRLSSDDSAVSRMPGDVVAEVTRIEREHGPAGVLGVACPGLVRPRGDMVYWMKGRLDHLEGLNWTAALNRRCPVPVINDAQAALKGEIWLGAGRGCRDVVMLTLGTGVGGAILLDGCILTGAMGRAGHFGHMTVNPTGEKDIVNTPGSLEDAIGNCTVARRSGGRFTSTEALVEAHLGGDAFARGVWHTSVQCLAASLASIINAVDPRRIILGGGIATGAGSALFDPLNTLMNDYEWRPDETRVEIVPAELGDEAGAIGSARHAMEWYDAD